MSLQKAALGELSASSEQLPHKARQLPMWWQQEGWGGAAKCRVGGLEVRMSTLWGGAVMCSGVWQEGIDP